MATYTLVITIIINQLLLAQVLALTSKPVTLSTDDVGSCLSADNREKALLAIRNNLSSTFTNFAIAPHCGDGLWYQVINLNFSDTTKDCPSNWTEISTPQVRACGRPPTRTGSCPGQYFSTMSLQYSKVCGRAIGYQKGSTDGFHAAPHNQNINNPYVDGVSVTHGMPRSHIWTFAVGNSEARVANYITNCPCANQSATTASPPSFVGNNYFCESGNPGKGLGSTRILLEMDPVWDGEQCEGVCCSNGKSPPWFSVSLPNPTSDDIEVRICGDESTGNEDSLIQLLKIYIQ